LARPKSSPTSRLTKRRINLGEGMRALRNGIGFSPLRRHPGDARDDAGAVGMFADRTEGAHGVIADFVTR
jgi:hypothetical protein